jgi:2'-5' RNA ligase
MILPNRLFLALLPDPATVDAVAHAAKRISLKLAHGGREIPKANLHLTLMFLGDAVPVLEERAACEAAADIRCAPFDLVLDGAGSFASAWWVGPHKASTELLQLRKSI